jgi:FMN-dependent NADH-azoreductase
MAPHNPAMSDLVPLFEASRSKALDEAAARAKKVAARVAA